MHALAKPLQVLRISPRPIAEAPRDEFSDAKDRGPYEAYTAGSNEKQLTRARIAAELENIPVDAATNAVRVFDAGMGNGAVLAGVAEDLRRRFAGNAHYIVAKEFSGSDVKSALDKMADHFAAHPKTVLVVTNHSFEETPWLSAPQSTWEEVALAGTTAAEFGEQVQALNGAIDDRWRTKTSAKTGNPVNAQRAVMVFYRADHKDRLENIIPQPGEAARADFGLAIASQPYRADRTAEFKAAKVLAPLVRSLAPGGVLIGTHAIGQLDEKGAPDGSAQIIEAAWPGHSAAAFPHSGEDIITAVKKSLGDTAHQYEYGVDKTPLIATVHAPDAHTATGLRAAWRAAHYVGQIRPGMVSEAEARGDHLKITADVLARNGGVLPVANTVYRIQRKLDLA